MRTGLLDAVAVDDDDDAFATEILREHVRLVTGLIRADQDRLAVGNHERIGATALGQPSPESLQHRIGSSFIAAGKDGDFASARREHARHLEHDGGLPRATDSEITHDHDLATEGCIAKKPVTIEPEAQAD